MWDSMQMENYPNEVSVQDYMRLMKGFLGRAHGREEGTISRQAAESLSPEKLVVSLGEGRNRALHL